MAASAVTCPFLRMAGPRVVGVLASPALSVIAGHCPHIAASGLTPDAVLAKMGGDSPGAQPKSHAQLRSTSSQLASPFSGARWYRGMK